MSTLSAIQRRRRGPCRAPKLAAPVFLVSGLVSGWGLPDEATAQRLSTPSAIRPAPTGRGKHCLGEAVNKTTLEHTVAGSINPLGIGNTLRLGWCTPLIKEAGPAVRLHQLRCRRADDELADRYAPRRADVPGAAFDLGAARRGDGVLHLADATARCGLHHRQQPQRIHAGPSVARPTGWNHNPPDGQPEGPGDPGQHGVWWSRRDRCDAAGSDPDRLEARHPGRHRRQRRVLERDLACLSSVAPEASTPLAATSSCSAPPTG